MVKELNLEEGVQEAISVIDGVTERPVLVVVYGWPNSGKSFLYTG